MLSNKALSAAGVSTPTFVSSSTSRGTNAANTVTAPTSIQDGDLLIAVGLHNSNSQAMTPPTGFSVIYLDNGGSNSTFIATKTASSESGNYTFTWTGNGNNTLAMLVYRNATRVNTIGAITAASSNTSTAASITPSYFGTLCGLFVNESTATVTTAPSGMTQRALHTANSPSLGVYDLSNQAPTATSAYSLVWSGTGSNIGIQFQVTNEYTVAPEFVASANTQNAVNGTSLVINKPTGTAEGDLMVAIMAIPTASTWTGDTDWTEVADQGANPSLRIAYKVAGASEGASYTFTSSASSTGSGCILTYRYAAYDTIGASFVTAANPLTPTAITTALSQSILIAAAVRGAASITLGTPPGMTARVTDNDATSPSYIALTQPVPKGSTGTRSISTGSSSNVSAIMLSIKPTRSLN